jgi:hypothetical protein
MSENAVAEHAHTKRTQTLCHLRCRRCSESASGMLELTLQQHKLYAVVRARVCEEVAFFLSRFVLQMHAKHYQTIIDKTCVLPLTIGKKHTHSTSVMISLGKGTERKS